MAHLVEDGAGQVPVAALGVEGDEGVGEERGERGVGGQEVEVEAAAEGEVSGSDALFEELMIVFVELVVLGVGFLKGRSRWVLNRERGRE